MEDNPYAAPQAESLQSFGAKGGGGGGGPVFPRQSLLAFIGLSVLTLGIYIPYWYRSRAQMVNLAAGREVTGLAPFSAAILIYLAALAVSFVSGFQGTEGGGLDQGLNTASNFANLIMAFKLRGAIHAAGHVRSGTPYWLGGVGTFFLGAFFLQYKINRVDYGDLIG